jgi:hypothetical protein
MSVDVPMYFLVQDGTTVFGPRRYYKPAFVRFAQVNKLEAEFPDVVSELVIVVGDKLVLVHESKLIEHVYTTDLKIKESTPDTETEISAVIEAALEPDELIITKPTTTRKKK